MRGQLMMGPKKRPRGAGRRPGDKLVRLSAETLTAIKRAQGADSIYWGLSIDSFIREKLWEQEQFRRDMTIRGRLAGQWRAPIAPAADQVVLTQSPKGSRRSGSSSSG